MTPGSPTIPKDPEPPAGMDFFRLRREAIDCISKLGSLQWTDYNTHDPGITLAEALLFTITDLSYRARWAIRDLLANAADQPFYTARTILTVNPVTPDDYRRLLIDLDGVRNAWVLCKQCACGDGAPSVRGLYDIQIELETDDVLGDLNDRVIAGSLRIRSGSDVHEIVVEARFPRIDLADQAQFDALLAPGAGPESIECIRFMRAKTGEAPSNTVSGDEELRRSWRSVFYATLLVRLPGAPLTPITIRDVSIRFFATSAGRDVLRVADLLALLLESGETGIVPLYRRKQQAALAWVAQAKACYHAHRNLDEDLCRLSVVSVGQIAVCAEVEVAPDADIEEVQAKVWLALEQYLAPAIPFYTLTELRAEGVAVEDIFNGPVLANGFIKQDDLDAAVLRGVVRASDIVNLLMDIEGVRSISELLMTRYDDDGNPVRGVADPRFENGDPYFDPDKLSASWLLYMADGQQPRLYYNLSNLKFRKNGLPLTVDQDEAYDTLTQLRGEQERPKQPGARNDLPVPGGAVRDAADISPVQYLLPRAYGVSAEGLPASAGTLRQAQAHQLKAYLMVFEQLLGNAFEQVAHVGDLFSTSPDVAATYFPHDFTAEIAGYDDVVDGLDSAEQQQLCETVPEFLYRRNKFLDHIIARFGLNFGDYALLLTDWKGDAVAKRELIADKLGILKAYPEISSGRARAFDHRTEALRPENGTVLKRRIALLLGYADLRLEWTCDASDPSNVKTTGVTLIDVQDKVWARGAPVFSGPSEAAVIRQATDVLLRRMSRPSAYTLHATEVGLRLVVRDESSAELAEAADPFATVREAESFRDELVATSSVARSIIVEHLLLRPKFPGDAQYQECAGCEDADPWSFRLTVVMPGWTAPYNVDLDWRDFANRTIQEEVPSHLVPKVCWVGDDDHEADPCDPVVDSLTGAIEKGAFTDDGARPTCQQALACALAAYELHAKAFAAWYAGKEHRVFGPQAATQVVAGVFAGITAADVACGLDLASPWGELQTKLVEHFVDVIVHGYQFTRFERVWYAWLEEDSRLDWGEERLVERLHAMLTSSLQGSTTTDLCACALALLETYGGAFSAWMAENLDRGRERADFTPFTPPAIELCEGASFVPGTVEAIAAFLEARYASYVEVSYRLSLLVRLLEALTNTYPAATLHDCDDGSDDNPVRLNRTALGSLSTGASEDVELIVQPEPGPRLRSARRRRKRKR